jgi:hypothetical protein
MRICTGLLFASCVAAGATFYEPAVAQEPAQSAVPCRDSPCAVTVDWTREGGLASQVPDRRYGNPTQLEAHVKARLTELGFANHQSANGGALRILVVPGIRNAMCDELAGTTTDMSCRAIVEIEARLEGPDALRRDVDLPSRIRNRCSSDRVMPVDRFGAFIADWIVYALEGRSKGERRPVARC